MPFGVESSLRPAARALVVPRAGSRVRPGARVVRCSDWGPASALEIAMEKELTEAVEKSIRQLDVFFYMTPPPRPFRLPGYVLRRRATYGGKKGRRAVMRLRARGLGPVKR